MKTLTFSSGTNVTSWADKSGNGNNGTGSGYPSLSNSGIYFNGLQYITGPISNTTNNLTVFVVANTVAGGSTANAGRIVSGAASGATDYDNTPSMDILVYNPFSSLTLNSFRNNVSLSTVTTPTNTPFVAVTRTNDTTNTLYLNGIAGTPVTLTGNAVGAFGLAKYSIASGITSGSGGMSLYNGTVYEVLFYNADVADADRQKIEGYLAQKWGLSTSFPLTQPYAKIPPAATLAVTPALQISYYANYLMTTFYANTGNIPDASGPTDQGGNGSYWGSIIQTAQALNPIAFGNNLGVSINGNANYSCITTGYVYSATTTTIQFLGYTDDGLIVNFNSTNVIYQYQRQGSTAYYSSTVTLPAGYTPIRITWYDSGGGGDYRIYFSINGAGFINDGTGVFYHLTSAPTNPISYTPQVFLTGYQYTSGSSTWADQSPNGRNATIENGTSQSGGAAHAVYLDGGTNWIFPNVGVAATWTCVVWCKITNIYSDGCVLTQIYTGGPFSICFGQGAQQGFSFYAPGWQVGTNIDIVGISSGAMACFTGVWDGSTLTTYINGSSVGSVGASAPYDSGNQYRIGRRWDLPDYVTGYVGEIRIYSQPFSSTQVMDDYNYVKAVRPY
jgi:hypothetical protein